MALLHFEGVLLVPNIQLSGSESTYWHAWDVVLLLH